MESVERNEKDFSDDESEEADGEATGSVVGVDEDQQSENSIEACEDTFSLICINRWTQEEYYELMFTKRSSWWLVNHLLNTVS